MFSLLCRKILISNVRVYGGSQTFLVALHDATFIRLFSSNKLALPKTEGDEKEQSFTVSYLINSCGLSLEAAISASEKVRLVSPEKPDLLLALFKNHGFSDAHISRTVSKYPKMLKADPQKTILPKLQFFQLMGVPAPVLAKVVSTSPIILMYSLQNSIIPAFNNLKILLQTDERVVHFFKRTASNYQFVYCVLKHTLPNVALLTKYGVSESNISYVLATYPRALIIRSDIFSKVVDRAIELGIDTKKIVFSHGLHVLLSTSKSTWEHKKGVYQRWGWSESDIRTAFLIQPICMSLSEKKIMSVMEFLVNEMGYRSSDIARYANVLCYNLEKRIKPRCRVAKVLMLRGLMDKSFKPHTLLVLSNEVFLNRYVLKYQEDIPLLDIYHGNLALEDLGLDSHHEESTVKQL